MELDFEWCYRAVDSRDGRFDGWFYTAVTSTGIYCRPSCPARTPHRRNVQFYRSAAAAHSAGFRACRRCRPDAVPGSPEWDNRADAVGRAMRLIADGVIDREGVPGLARRLGYTQRHLHRMLTTAVGAGPLALARAQRAQTARILVERTGLGLAEIAFAAGFGSVRQFNDTIQQVYGVAPSGLRNGAPARRAAGTAGAARAAGREPAAAGPRQPAAGTAGTVTLRLAYRPPLAAEALFRFLATRAVPGVEAYDGASYHRMLRLPHGPAAVALRPADGHIAATLRLADLRDLAPAVARCRRLLDLDADPTAVDATLAADPVLAGDVAKEPGVRVPRAVDGFEIAVRGIVGQQISVAGARTVLARLAQAAANTQADAQADAAPEADTAEPGHSDRLVPFPGPTDLLAVPDAAFPMPARRRDALRALSRAVLDGELDLDPGADRALTATRLRRLPGIGDWTADYVALRALGDPDTFLPTDLGARRGAAALGLPAQPPSLATRAVDWAPWRSYALIRLWRYA